MKEIFERITRMDALVFSMSYVDMPPLEVATIPLVAWNF